MQSRLLLRVCAVVLTLLGGPAVRGYVVQTDESGVYVIKWHSSPVEMEVKLPSTPNLIDGGSQRSAVIAAAEVWNVQLGTVRISAQASAPGAYASGNEKNEIVMDSTVDGEAFPSGALAITVSYSRGNDMAESDIVFNTAYTWNSYRGALRRDIEDIRRVAVHELGHVLGLDHPDEHGQYVTALMNSHVSAIETLQPDDIEGVHLLYGAPGVRPGNDQFGNAAPITLNVDRAIVTGSNIGATREPGEPDHAASTGKHSVWWKWLAPADGKLELDTRGSNFDTVLAVYAGASLAGLTPVGWSDDEESPEQNPSPQRKRTSKVTVDVTKGTTYNVAVDGWGNAEGIPTGCTGSVTLTAVFIEVVAPAFTAQPTDLTINAGETGGFVATITGRPLPDRKWQRQRPGSSEWVDIGYEGAYRGGQSSGSDYTITTYLWVTTDHTMNGDRFRFVATNFGGTAISNPVTLHVNSMPLPVINVQPVSKRLLAGVSGRISVQATGAVSYQWYRNGTALNGQTQPILYFADPQAADAGEYYVKLTNPGGAVQSATATIAVSRPAVITNLDATRQVLRLHDTLSLHVSATGTGTLKYQWYHDGRSIKGATNTSFTRRIDSAADTGAYWVAVTDDMGTRHGAPFFSFLSRPRTNVVAWGSNAWRIAEVPPTLMDAVALSAGTNLVLALRANGTVVAWGDTGTMRTDFTDAVAVAAETGAAVVLKADGTVAVAGNTAAAPAKLNEVWSIAAGDNYALALKTDGTVVGWGTDVPPVYSLEDIVAIAPVMSLRRDGLVSHLRRHEIWPWEDTPNDNIVAIASGKGSECLGLKADGTMAWNPAPAAATQVIAIAAGATHALALKADGTVVAWDGNQAGETCVPAGLSAVFAIAAGNYTSYAIRDTSVAVPLLITTQPVSASTFLGIGVELFANAAGGSGTALGFQWRRNGSEVVGAGGRSYNLPSLQPADAGIYTLDFRAETTVTSGPAVVAPLLPPWAKFAGAAKEVGVDIVHPNGNIFDQVLATGAAEAIICDSWANQITRTSFIDLDGDIVQVEFSGPGTLSLVLDGFSGPAAPANYHQPGVQYVKGHAGIVIAGADERTNVSVFSVGRATAFDPTGVFDITQSISATNDPAKNGSPLFQGHATTDYDGIADIAFIAILSTNGKFGGVRTANANYFASQGYTGLYAPGVEFAGPVYVGDVSAFDSAKPVIVLGAASDVRITGGDLLQNNRQPVQVSGITQLRFVDGSDSHGNLLPAQRNRAVLTETGTDVTAQTLPSL